MKVYLIHPYQGADRASNYYRIGRIARIIAHAGIYPLSSIHAYSFLCDWNEEERCFGLQCGLSLLSWADEAWVIYDMQKTLLTSAGSRKEIAEAKRQGIPVRGDGGDKFWQEVGKQHIKLSQRNRVTVNTDVLLGLFQQLALWEGPKIHVMPLDKGWQVEFARTSDVTKAIKT